MQRKREQGLPDCRFATVIKRTNDTNALSIYYKCQLIAQDPFFYVSFAFNCLLQEQVLFILHFNTWEICIVEDRDKICEEKKRRAKHRMQEVEWLSIM